MAVKLPNSFGQQLLIGTVGLYIHNASADYDNVVVTSLAMQVPEPTPPLTINWDIIDDDLSDYTTLWNAIGSVAQKFRICDNYRVKR